MRGLRAKLGQGAGSEYGVADMMKWWVIALLMLGCSDSKPEVTTFEICEQMRAMSLEELRDWIGSQYVSSPTTSALLTCIAYAALHPELQTTNP